MAEQFLSTPSARRATHFSLPTPVPPSISIHALREEGDEVFVLGEVTVSISIHALREEGDSCCRRQHRGQPRFLSTPSARRATSVSLLLTAGRRFLSTPSARRATTASGELDCENGNFYPRPPRGGRPMNMLHFVPF